MKYATFQTNNVFILRFLTFFLYTQYMFHIIFHQFSRHYGFFSQPSNNLNRKTKTLQQQMNLLYSRYGRGSFWSTFLNGRERKSCFLELIVLLTYLVLLLLYILQCDDWGMIGGWLEDIQKINRLKIEKSKGIRRTLGKGMT